MEHIIAGCNNCCLCAKEETEYYCLHPKSIDVDIKQKNYKPITPDNCPLNSEPLNITKEQK